MRLKRWIVVVVVLCAGLGAFAYLQHSEPSWYARFWYPLRYSTNVRVYARQDNLDPALLAAVIEAESKLEPDARSNAGAIGLMQLTPATAKGHRPEHRRQPLPPLRPHQPGHQHPRDGARPIGHLLAKYGQRAARARRLQRGPGERRPLAAVARGHTVRQDAATTSPRSSGCRRSTAVHTRPNSGTDSGHEDPRRGTRGVRRAARGAGARARRAEGGRGARPPRRVRRLPHRPLHGVRRRPLRLLADRARARGRGGRRAGRRGRRARSRPATTS